MITDSTEKSVSFSIRALAGVSQNMLEIEIPMFYT